MAKKTTKGKKRGNGALTRADQQFHQLVHEWHAHIKDELALHKQIHSALAGGRRDVQKHLKQTLAMQERFVQRLKKL